MGDTITIDILQFGSGCLLGLFAGILLKLKSLKSLDLKLNRIGVDLGVQGFQPETTDGSIQNTVQGPVGGDFVGRDKKTTNQSFFDKLQQSVSSSISATEQAFVKSTLFVAAPDEAFSEHLRKLYGQEDFFYRYVKACLERPEFVQSIRRKVAELSAEGWRTHEITFDNHSANGRNGLHVTFNIGRRLPSAT